MKQITSYNETDTPLLKEFPALYGTRRFITVITRARHWSLSWATRSRFKILHPLPWRLILILCSHLCLVSSKWYLPLGLSKSSERMILNGKPGKLVTLRNGVSLLKRAIGLMCSRTVQGYLRHLNRNQTLAAKLMKLNETTAYGWKRWTLHYNDCIVINISETWHQYELC
jgi:hypothetical protein